MGDLHGNANAFNMRVAQYIDNPTSEDIIICTGDVGLEYGGRTYGNLKKAMKKFPGIILVMRGNHDDCYWVNHGYIDEEGWYQFNNNSWEYVDEDTQMFIRQKKYPNIWYIDDNGGIYTIGNYTILFLPGAYSVDKHYRLRNGFPWNPQEQMTEEIFEELYDVVKKWLEIGFDFDFVIGHTFPQKMEPYYKDLFMDGINQAIVDKTTEKWLDKFAELFESAPAFKQYFGGHFHADRVLTDKYTMLYHKIVELSDYEEE